jgi:hypothetical protein
LGIAGNYRFVALIFGRWSFSFSLSGRFMRATFLTIFFALVASYAMADQIDNVVTNLPDGWNDNEAGLIIMPKTASTKDVLQRAFRVYVFGFGQITNFTVLKTRQVPIPCCHFPGASIYSYTAALVQASQGGKVVVLLRYIDVYTSRAWLSAVFYANP